MIILAIILGILAIVVFFYAKYFAKSNAHRNMAYGAAAIITLILIGVGYSIYNDAKPDQPPARIDGE